MEHQTKQNLRVGIQGVRASFHEVAARKFFTSQVIEPIECQSFKILSNCLKNKEADFCLMAIENSIAGSILTNYSLMETYGFKIVGEVYLRIELSVVALKGQNLTQIKSIQSHPMALLQCADFLTQHPHITVQESADTAESAKIISEKKMMGWAAVAHKLAAQAYGLEVLEEGIESNKQNYTRFLVICRKEDYKENSKANKASLRFEATHQPGSLAKILTLFSEHQINMTKVQSVPILGKPYEYSFHVDLEWESADKYRAAMDHIQDKVTNLIHFGDYPKGERPVT